MSEINYEEFQKVEMKVGRIKKAEKIEGTDNLLKLKVDVGKDIQLVAGIAQHYSAEELKNKKIVVVTNLKPIMLKGVESNGMLLAASNEDDIVLLTTDKDIEAGAKIK